MSIWLVITVQQQHYFICHMTHLYIQTPNTYKATLSSHLTPYLSANTTKVVLITVEMFLLIIQLPKLNLHRACVCCIYQSIWQKYVQEIINTRNIVTFLLKWRCLHAHTEKSQIFHVPFMCRDLFFWSENMALWHEALAAEQSSQHVSAEQSSQHVSAEQSSQHVTVGT